MSERRWDRFRTGQALQGRLLQELVGKGKNHASLTAGTLVGPGE